MRLTNDSRRSCIAARSARSCASVAWSSTVALARSTDESPVPMGVALEERDTCLVSVMSPSWDCTPSPGSLRRRLSSDLSTLSDCRSKRSCRADCSWRMSRTAASWPSTETSMSLRPCRSDSNSSGRAERQLTISVCRLWMLASRLFESSSSWLALSPSSFSLVSTWESTTSLLLPSMLSRSSSLSSMRFRRAHTAGPSDASSSSKPAAVSLLGGLGPACALAGDGLCEGPADSRGGVRAPEPSTVPGAPPPVIHETPARRVSPRVEAARASPS
mmetsp:Transcript_83527/g.236498  ORF Transcript_83527/g.236498 Transcript_83527/m.236498 type:complete len:274 (-) Transcript_83527:134-955(-)